jgi:hypothetical protein
MLVGRRLEADAAKELSAKLGKSSMVIPVREYTSSSLNKYIDKLPDDK